MDGPSAEVAGDQRHHSGTEDHDGAGTGVTCESVREAMSALLDGEPMPLTAQVVADHVRLCPDCGRWEADAADLNRTLRVAPADPVPDLSDLVLARSPERRPLAAARRWRWALAAAGAAQALLGVAQLAGMDHTSHLAMADPSHLFNESAAWNLALGLGFLAAAARPALARGLLPTLAAFVLVLFAVSIVDLTAGRIDPSRVLSHALVAVGLVLLLVVARGHRPSPAPEGARLPSWTADPTRSGDEPARTFDGDEGGSGSGRPLRPAGRHRAA